MLVFTTSLNVFLFAHTKTRYINIVILTISKCFQNLKIKILFQKQKQQNFFFFEKFENHFTSENNDTLRHIRHIPLIPLIERLVEGGRTIIKPRISLRIVTIYCNSPKLVKLNQLFHSSLYCLHLLHSNM